MQNLQKKGWVRLHRCIEDNPLWFSESFTRSQAWIDLFLNANHKNSTIFIRGNEVQIKRSQIGWSELTMCKRWRWSRNKVRRFLRYLEMKQQIVQQKDRYITTIITILNYEKYQNDTANDTAERQQKDSRKYINKKVKNDKNDKKTTATQSVAGEINPLIEKFKPINPSYTRLYANKTQRAALERLIKTHGLEKTQWTIEVLTQTNGKRFAPTITTPLQLEDKLAQLIVFLKKTQSSGITKIS